ncbi:MAG TPA: ATP-binding protein [Candidatus Dormibacteraeota bacterium]|nr:ATP-binding protein [Candidatus Dormibacteraeota bacterium]
MTSNHRATKAAVEQGISPEDHARAILNILEDFSEDKGRVEQTQHAVFNILEDFSQEKSRLEKIQRATLNLLEDFDAEGSKMQQMQRAVFNILEDSSVEKGRLELTQRATLNLLEDFDAEGSKMQHVHHAVFNMLEDFSQEKARLEETQRATLNLLGDFDAERSKAEEVSDELRESVVQIHAAKEAAEASNRELEAFSYSVSHDLRAPVRHVMGFSEILTKEYGAALPPDAQHHLQRIQQGARRMGQLVDDLLSLARLGRQGLRLEKASLNRLVEEVISELMPDTSGRQLQWKVGDLPAVECDGSLVKQVFQNLLSNALKFTRSRPRAVIEVGCMDQAGTPVVFVRDNGVGFNMKYADKLFGVFQRLHRAEDFEGTGVGLATVQRIIQKHGGRIWPEAALDKGATFYFTLGASEKTELKTKAAMAGDKP